MQQIDVGKMTCFGDSENCEFFVLTETHIAEVLEFVDTDRRYSSVSTVIIEDNDAIYNWLRDNQELKKSVIIAAPSIYTRSPDPSLLGKSTKLGTLACYSTPSTPDSIAHFLKQAEKTDSQYQDKMGDAFFANAEKSLYLVFYDRATGTEARFEHLEDSLQWHEQIGVLDWGQQQLLPSGEISTLPVSVFGQNIDSRLKFNGVITVSGVVVLHSGSVSFLPEDQEQIYQSLKAIENSPIYLTIEQGAITKIDADEEDHPARLMLEAMIAVDSRYATLIEIGFGINTNLELYPSNNAMNEVYGGNNGVMHFGFGLLPYTQYHMDFLCPNTSVLNEANEVVFGEA